MDREGVKSGHIKSVGYEGGEIEVEFINGSIYRYPNSTQGEFDEMMKSESIGSYLHKNLKGRDVVK